MNQQWKKVARLRVLTAGAVAMATVLLSACGGSSTSSVKAPTGPIAFGELIPLTGRAANPGARFLHGIKVGVKDVNSNGGILGQQIEEFLGDTGSDAVDSVPAFRQLETHSPSVIIGSTSIEEPSVKGMVDGAKVPQLANLPGTLYDGLSDPLIYRIAVPDSALAKAMAYYAINSSWTKCSLAFENVQSAQSLVQPLLDAYKKHNGTVLDNVQLVPHQTSYRTEITKLFAQNPQCIFIQTDPQTSGTFFSDARELGHFNIPYIGTDQNTDVTIAKAAGLADASKWLTGTSGALPTGPSYDHFSTGYKAQFTDDPSYFAAAFYDAVIVAALAMTSAGTADKNIWYKSIGDVTGDESATEVTTYAEGVKLLKEGKKIDYEGASANMDFDKTHTVFTDVNIVKFDTSANLQTVSTVKAKDLAAY
ncbi:MAG: hypothetical protein QOK05_2037 [Chloroflexota bacterium]|jgi:branched-chain amino acid transport system substrate-binding protein|nr:hypothetical protein [Chloroflexota bacterium]